MKSFEHRIEDPQGFHARPVVLVAAEARKWDCRITVAVKRDGAVGEPVLAHDPLALMALDAVAGDVLVVTLEGEDECEAEQGMRLACAF